MFSRKKDRTKKSDGRLRESRRMYRQGWRKDRFNIGFGPRKAHHDYTPFRSMWKKKRAKKKRRVYRF